MVDNRSLRIGGKEIGIFRSKFIVSCELSTIVNLDSLEWLVTRAFLNLFRLFTDRVSADNSSVNRVLAVEMWSVLVADEELRTVRVWTGIGHRKNTFMSVREPNLLVLELLSINTLATCAVSSSRITSLHHEVRDDSVEAVALVVELFSLFSCAECSKILCSLWHVLIENLKYNSTGLIAIFAFFSDRDIKVRLHIFLLEVWKAIMVARYFGIIFLIVDTFFEESRKSFLLLLSLARFLVFDRRELITQLDILWR